MKIQSSKKIIAIVPARNGSKGLKNKNILKFGGKPLYMWPVDAALRSKIFSKIIISTDISKILDSKIDNVIIHKRPKKYCSDSSPSSELIIDVLKKYIEDEIYFCLLEPTSPFTDSIDIINAYSKITKNKVYNSLVSIMRNEKYHPSLNFKKKLNTLNPIMKNFKHIRRQDLGNSFCLDGSIYISNIKAYLKKKSFITSKTTFIELKKYKNIEIDDIFDFKYSEIILRNIL